MYAEILVVLTARKTPPLTGVLSGADPTQIKDAAFPTGRRIIFRLRLDLKQRGVKSGTLNYPDRN